MRNGFLWRALTLGALAFSLAISAFSNDIDAFGQSNKQSKRPTYPLYVRGEAIVKFKPGIQSAGEKAHGLMNALSQNYALTVEPVHGASSFARIKVEGQAPLGQLLTDIQGQDSVQYAEPNWLYHNLEADTVYTSEDKDVEQPNDPDFSNNWGLFNTGQDDSDGQSGTKGADIGAPKAWKSGTGSKDIVVAIIDTGMDYNHVDLKNNVFINKKETAGNGKDDDANGYIDDIHGWNFVGKNNDPMDDNHHGTHVAGTIGAEGNNGVGTVGVNWHVSMMPLKFLSAKGSGNTADAIEAVKYGTKMGVHMMSNSWGGGGFSKALLEAITDAKNHGILFVVAAGNDGSDNENSPSYPASYDVDNIVSVAATDNRDQMADFSNWGAKHVHLGAPGVNIYSTFPQGKYGYLSGTSMATPHVSGAAALLWSLHKDWTYAQIKAQLLKTVDPLRSLLHKTTSGGRLNIANAIGDIVPPKLPEPDPNSWKAVAQTTESVHPYAPNSSARFEISHPGAKFMRVHFQKLDTEREFDTVTLEDSQGHVVERYDGKSDDRYSEYVEGDNMVLKLVSDNSVESYGFLVDRYEFID